MDLINFDHRFMKTKLHLPDTRVSLADGNSTKSF